MDKQVFQRLEQQLRFIIELDRLKHVYRQTYLTDGTRKENSAEHSWHLAMMAVILSEYSAAGYVNIFRVVKMVLVHDIVEIDAGDTYCYDEAANCDKADRELRAAERLFALLPEDQAIEYRRLWDEFEEGTTPEAKFAAALDRLQPMMQNYFSQGKSWKEHGITAERVVTRNGTMREGAPFLWEFAYGLVQDAQAKGWLADK